MKLLANWGHTLGAESECLGERDEIGFVGSGPGDGVACSIDVPAHVAGGW